MQWEIMWMNGDDMERCCQEHFSVPKDEGSLRSVRMGRRLLGSIKKYSLRAEKTSSADLQRKDSDAS